MTGGLNNAGVEAVARAIAPPILWEFDAWRLDRPVPWDKICVKDQTKLREIARAAIDALTAISPITTGVSEAWQPIETAPKDGTKIDVWTRDGERWPEVWWSVKKSDWMHWWLGDFDSMGETRLGERLTHWRPLPEPPAMERARLAEQS